MAFPLYFALTGAEFRLCPQLPVHCGWLACHFSPYSTGITNIPQNLPKNSMLILDDSTPINGHDSQQIIAQISALNIDSVLLDFQRPPTEESLDMARALTGLSCPVGVSESHAQSLSCPVFLSAPPLHIPLNTYIVPWQDREIWLEISLGQECITIDEKGQRNQSWFVSDLPVFSSPTLACRYQTVLEDREVSFLFHRTKEDLSALLSLAQSLGITRAVGLYQELQ